MTTHTYKSTHHYGGEPQQNQLLIAAGKVDSWYNDGDRHTIASVKEWHDKFGVPVPNEPTVNHPATNALRIALLEEEINELRCALNDRDLVEVLDALTDLQYILDGTYLALGLGHLKRAAFDEVHRSNMSKMGANGMPVKRNDGKILKGPNYSKPNLEQFLK